jgi:hypothetical protein
MFHGSTHRREWLYASPAALHEARAAAHAAAVAQPVGALGDTTVVD